ncbi:MAG: hypothetical protein JRI96_05510 [Deltaproteobacteria bacterium]|nr:hypothetical protein [Deltaproteobacteria bacterium]
MKEKGKLERISHHLWYEFEMFLALTQELSKGYPPSTINNALLESFALHVRNLIDFLYNENPKSDDVCAFDFFLCKEDWLKVRPQITPLLEESKKRANKEASHLTYARINVTLEGKKWYFIKICRDMNRAFEVFVENVNKELLSTDWDNFLQVRENYKRRLLSQASESGHP